ncbi:MAG TPA: hypothetical protein VGO27_22010 [Candidatus Acidoferrum sp.]|jgi:hypothetical protein|nr:hypothetical protein [Candidatus Acidoferrum sp.]
MMERKLTLAEIILIAGTRVALGAGLGLLLSSRLSNDQRKAAGLALALVGGLTTIPLALGVIWQEEFCGDEPSRLVILRLRSSKSGTTTLKKRYVAASKVMVEFRPIYSVHGEFMTREARLMCGIIRKQRRGQNGKSMVA